MASIYSREALRQSRKQRTLMEQGLLSLLEQGSEPPAAAEDRFLRLHWDLTR